MKNAEKYREEYLELKKKLWENKKEYEALFDKHRIFTEDWWKNPLYDKYKELIDYIKENEYEDDLRKWKVEISEIADEIDREHKEDIVKLHSLFLEKKQLKWRLGHIKWVILRNFLSSK